MANPSSYTEADYKAINEALDQDPHQWCWTTQEGLRIPLRLIKDSHLKNIKKHIDAHPKNYVLSKARPIIINEWKRRFANTAAGKVLFGG